MNEMEVIRRIGMASLPLLAAALLVVWAYWTSFTGIADESRIRQSPSAGEPTAAVEGALGR